MCDIAPFGMECVYEKHADKIIFCCVHHLNWQLNEIWSNTIILKHFIKPYHCPDFELKGVTTMPNELKPCPFCGGEAEVIEIYLYGKVKGYMAHCNKCGCELKCYTSKQNAKNFLEQEG